MQEGPSLVATHGAGANRAAFRNVLSANKARKRSGGRNMKRILIVACAAPVAALLAGCTAPGAYYDDGYAYEPAPVVRYDTYHYPGRRYYSRDYGTYHRPYYRSGYYRR
jgi:hypothetical protein